MTAKKALKRRIVILYVTLVVMGTCMLMIAFGTDDISANAVKIALCNSTVYALFVFLTSRHNNKVKRRYTVSINIILLIVFVVIVFKFNDGIALPSSAWEMATDIHYFISCYCGIIMGKKLLKMKEVEEQQELPEAQ